MSEMKRCSKCREAFPKTNEYFGACKQNVDGLEGQCKSCVAIYQKKYRNKNKDVLLEKKKLYYLENKEIILEKVNEYQCKNADAVTKRKGLHYKKNRDRILLAAKHYYNENKENIIKYHKKYNFKNRKIISGKCKEYQRKHLDGSRIRNHNRRARILNLQYTLTVRQWKDIKQYFNNKCAYCGKEKILTQDHFIAVNNGGEYTHNNIIPACKSCNCSKKDHDFFVWYPRQSFYSKKRERKILNYLHYDNNHQQQLSLV